MNISADVWVVILVMLAFGAGAILGETKKVRPIVIGAGASAVVASAAIYLHLV